MDHNTLWTILNEMGLIDHFTCLPRNQYAGKKPTVRTRHGATNWFKIGKGVCQGCILSPCSFDLHAEYVIQNIRLEESQAGIKIAKKNTDNLRNTDDTTLMRESKEELKSFLMMAKED